MILIAVIVGYLLGIIPFIVPKLFKTKEEQSNKQMEDYYKNQEDILNEWLNEKEKTQSNGISQEEIFQEYITGQETRKGE